MRKRMGVALTAAVLAAGACGDGPTDVVGGLDRQELEALAEVVGATVVSTFEHAEGPAAGPGMAPLAAIREERSVSFTADCDLGGTLAVTGDLEADIDDEAGTATLAFAVTQVHQGCTVRSQDGVVFTLTGAPDVTSTLLVNAGDERLSFEGTYEGAVEWETEDKDGLCSLSVTFDLELDFAGETGSAAFVGTVCGVSFSRNVTVD